MKGLPPMPPQTPEYRHENALKWIHMIAGLHYFGGAFEPRHMRTLSNIAADALDGTRELPDFEEAQDRSREKARELADNLGLHMTDDEADRNAP